MRVQVSEWVCVRRSVGRGASSLGAESDSSDSSEGQYDSDQRPSRDAARPAGPEPVDPRGMRRHETAVGSQSI